MFKEIEDKEFGMLIIVEKSEIKDFLENIGEARALIIVLLEL